ncbi:MAG: SDR family oxidoreductase [Deltaproteobacteria bacterium]|nr:SDR family oxidoreductase [Deltaproteobacteria bacterium]
MKRFEKKTVLITGAGQGIGFEIAKQFHLEGATVLLNDIDEALCQKAAARIDNTLTTCIPFAGDSGDIGFLKDMFAKIDARFPSPDVVIANTGYSLFRTFLDMTPESLRDVMRINIEGTFFLLQFAAKRMIQAKTKGRLIVMSSVTGQRAHRELTVYGMTKGALETLVRNLVVELSQHGLTVNAIAPGATLTERTLSDDSYQATWARLTPLGKAASTADIAQTALFLASQAAGHITGQTIVVDGGWTAISPGPEMVSES